jgi:hypothetical protein
LLLVLRHRRLHGTKTTAEQRAYQRAPRPGRRACRSAGCRSLADIGQPLTNVLRALEVGTHIARIDDCLI